MLEMLSVGYTQYTGKKGPRIMIQSDRCCAASSLFVCFEEKRAQTNPTEWREPPMGRHTVRGHCNTVTL